MVFFESVTFVLLVCMGLTEAVTPSSGLTEAVTTSPGLTEAVTPSPGLTEAVTHSPGLTEDVTPSPGLTEAVTPSPAKNDTLSKACQVSYGIAKGKTAKDDCKITEQIQLGMTFHRLIVSILYCTEEEFNQIKLKLCGEPADNLNQSSALTVKVYQQLSIMDERCIEMSLRCIVSDPLAIIFKQLEQYCEVMTLVMSCPKVEHCNFHFQLHTAACRSTHSKPFITAIVTRKLKCRSSLQECLKSKTKQLTTQFRLMTAQRYCDLMLLAGPNATQTCLLNNGCTAQDINVLKTFACNGSPHPVSVAMVMLILLYSLQAG